MGTVVANNIKRRLDSRAMLQRNDREIEDLFNQGHSLDDAMKIQQQRWGKIPVTSRDAGVLMGVAVGE